MALDKQVTESVIKEFGLNAQDTGSTEVQIALLTKRVEELTGHCQTHGKDFSSRRGLLKLVSERRRLLTYLGKQDERKCAEIKKRLGLRG